jgi:hypothetical protein
MALNCKFEELDDETRGYLRQVRSRKGRGAPGVYVPAFDARPLVAFLVGPLVGLVLFFLALRSSKDAWAVAMLQTAGLLVGGWCVLYALRRWFAGGNSYGGTFAYFDPLHAYQVRGETVTVTRLRQLRAVEADGPRVWFDMSGTEASVPVGSVQKARLVEDYYAAMDQLERQEDGPWRTAPAAELGAAALMTAEDGKPPRTAEHLDLDLERVPEDPGRDKRAGLGLLGLFLIPAAAVGLFLVLSMVNRPLGDDFAFEQAKADGAPGLRGYLLDDRNTRNRDEARRLLAQQYDAPINKLNAAPPPKNPELRQGMVKLLEMLRTSETPAVAIAVSEENANAADIASAGRAIEMRRELADGLARGIGPTLIAFAEPPAGQPAHVTIRYRLTPDMTGNTSATVEVEVRTDLEKPPVAKGSFDAIPAKGGIPTATAVSVLKSAICTELVGSYVPAPPPDFGGGSF